MVSNVIGASRTHILVGVCIGSVVITSIFRVLLKSYAIIIKDYLFVFASLKLTSIAVTVPRSTAIAARPDASWAVYVPLSLRVLVDYGLLLLCLDSSWLSSLSSHHLILLLTLLF